MVGFGRITMKVEIKITYDDGRVINVVPDEKVLTCIRRHTQYVTDCFFFEDPEEKEANELLKLMAGF